MKKWIGILALAGGLLLSGCASLLERSYSVVEPYADRYWDASAEDTLRAESYQDLVNSLLLLVEEHSEEGVIRYYTEGNAYSLALQATWEVREDTMLGSYLLEDLSFRYETGEEGVCTLTYELIYREDAEWAVYRARLLRSVFFPKVDGAYQDISASYVAGAIREVTEPSGRVSTWFCSRPSCSWRRCSSDRAVRWR